MKALVFDNTVVQLEETTFTVHKSMTWMDAPQNCEVGWVLKDGVLQKEPEPKKTQKELMTEYAQAIQGMLDAKAGEKDYDNAFTCATYVNSTNTTWAQEATDFIAWRDACWQYAIDVQNDVESGAIEAPSLVNFISNAPILNW